MKRCKLQNEMFQSGYIKIKIMDFQEKHSLVDESVIIFGHKFPGQHLARRVVRNHGPKNPKRLATLYSILIDRKFQ